MGTYRMKNWPIAPASLAPELKKEFATHASDGRVGNELLSETDRVRVWAIGLKRGQRPGFHTHVLDYFWTSVTTGHGRGRVASVADPAIFKSGRDLAAWIGLVPRQNSSGGKERLAALPKAATVICGRCSWSGRWR
jgi:hypothetical protein